MSNISKVKIWKIISGSNHFWIVTLILYFQSRGLSLSQSLQLISIYTILVVILEYPTGVIGDFFSHKTSIIVATILGAIGFVLLALPGSFLYYALVISLASLSITLTSGSDTALIHSVSNDFKNDLGQITIYSLILSTINITIGGLVGAIDLRYPLYLSFIFLLPTFPLLLTLKNIKHEKEQGNIFANAVGGLKDIFSNPKLRSLIVISSAFGAFFVSIKWFYNPLFEKIDIPVSYWGVITGGAFLLVALGTQIYRKYDKFNLTTTSIVCLAVIFLIGITNFWLSPLLGIWLTHILRGYQDTHLGVLTNEAIITGRRASIISFNNLATRLVSAIYLAGVGFLLPISSFMVVISITVILIGAAIYFPLRKFGKL